MALGILICVASLSWVKPELSSQLCIKMPTSAPTVWEQDFWLQPACWVMIFHCGINLDSYVMRPILNLSCIYMLCMCVFESPSLWAYSSPFSNFVMHCCSFFFLWFVGTSWIGGFPVSVFSISKWQDMIGWYLRVTMTPFHSFFSPCEGAVNYPVAKFASWMHG